MSSENGGHLHVEVFFLFTYSARFHQENSNLSRDSDSEASLLTTSSPDSVS